MPDHALLVGHFFSVSHWLDSRPLGNGNINDTYLVRFQSESAPLAYVLQRLNHRVFQQPMAVMQNTQKVNQHLLADPQYPYWVPALVPTREGNLLYRDDAGNYWRMLAYLAHADSPEGRVTAAVAWEAAKAYGAFARSLSHFPVGQLAETIPGFHDTDQRWAYFLQVLAQDSAQRATAVKAELEAIFNLKNVFERVSHLKKSGLLPLRVTHNDTKAGNILLDNATQKAAAVIDLDTVMGGTILSDFGDMVRTFCPTVGEDDPAEVSVNMDVLGALTEGFLSEMGDFLVPAERDNLLLGAQWIIAEQALRFLTDYLAGDVYFKIKYPEHNLVRAQNQIKLVTKILTIKSL